MYVQETYPVRYIVFEKYCILYSLVNARNIRCNNNKRFQPQILQNVVFAARVDLFIYRIYPFGQTNLYRGRDRVFDLSVKFNLPQVFYEEHIQIYGVMMSS